MAFGHQRESSDSVVARQEYSESWSTRGFKTSELNNGVVLKILWVLRAHHAVYNPENRKMILERFR